MTYLKRLAPPWLRKGTPGALLDALGAPLEQWREDAAQALELWMRPDGAPSSWLPWLAYVVGLPLLDLPEQRVRRLIAAAIAGWYAKGTPAAIEAWLQALAGVDAELRSVQETAAIAGLAIAGIAVAGPGASTAWRFEVAIPAGSIDAATLRALLSYQVSALMQYRIVDLDDNLISDFA